MPTFVHAVFYCALLKVLQIFEEVQRRHRQGQTNSAFEFDLELPDTLSDELSERGPGDSTTATVSL